MIAVLRGRNFLLLWLGGLISQAGDWVLAIALPVHVYNLTGSTLATGGVFLTQSLPRLLLGLIAGVVVDRWDRRWIMISADLGRSAILPLLLLVQTADQLSLLYVIAAAEAILGLFFVPAHAAFLSRIVGDQEVSRGERPARAGLGDDAFGGTSCWWLAHGDPWVVRRHTPRQRVVPTLRSAARCYRNSQLQCRGAEQCFHDRKWTLGRDAAGPCHRATRDSKRPPIASVVFAGRAWIYWRRDHQRAQLPMAGT